MTVYSPSEEGRYLTWQELINWYSENPDKLEGKTIKDIVDDVINYVVVGTYTGDKSKGHEAEISLGKILENPGQYGIEPADAEYIKSQIDTATIKFIDNNQRYAVGPLTPLKDVKGVIHTIHFYLQGPRTLVGQYGVTDETSYGIANYEFTQLDNLQRQFQNTENIEGQVATIIGDSNVTGFELVDFYPQLKTNQVTGERVASHYGNVQGFIASEDGLFYNLQTDEPVKDANGNNVRAVFKLGDADALVADLTNLEIKELQDLMIFYDRETYEPLIEREGFLSSTNAELMFVAMLMEEGNNSILMNALNPETYDNVVANYNPEVRDWNNLGFGATKTNVVKGLIDKTLEINAIDDAMGVGSDYWREARYNLINPSTLEMEAEVQKYFNSLGLNMTAADAVRFGQHLIDTRSKEATRQEEIGKQAEIFLSGTRMLETQALVTEKPILAEGADALEKQAYEKNLALYNEYVQAKEDGRIRVIAGVGEFITPTVEEVRDKYNMPVLETYNSELEFNKILETELADRITAVNNVQAVREQAAKFQNRFISARQFFTGG